MSCLHQCIGRDLSHKIYDEIPDNLTTKYIVLGFVENGHFIDVSFSDVKSAHGAHDETNELAVQIDEDIQLKHHEDCDDQSVIR